MMLHRGLQLAIGEVLDSQVDAGLEVLARPRGPDALHVLDDPALRVLDYALQAVDAGE